MIYLEVNLKALYIFFIALLIATPVYAEQALVLSEIERIQEKIWYLQKDLAAQNTSIKKHQAQLERLTSKTNEGHLSLNERLATLEEFVDNQQEVVSQTGEKLETLTETLVSLGNSIEERQENINSQTERIETLNSSIRSLQDNFSKDKKATEQTLAEIRSELDETRSQLKTMGQDVGSQVEQLSVWGAGIFLALAILLTIGFALRKSGSNKPATNFKQPPNHEM